MIPYRLSNGAHPGKLPCGGGWARETGRNLAIPSHLQTIRQQRHSFRGFAYRPQHSRRRARFGRLRAPRTGGSGTPGAIRGMRRTHGGSTSAGFRRSNRGVGIIGNGTRRKHNEKNHRLLLIVAMAFALVGCGTPSEPADGTPRAGR